MTPEQLNTAIKATDSLTVNELADLLNHLGDGTLEKIRDEPWKHHIAHLLPTANDADAVHTLWVLLIDVHDERYMRASRKRTE